MKVALGSASIRAWGLLLAVLLLQVPVGLSAYITFTAHVRISESQLVTKTVGIQSCGFDDNLLAQVTRLGKSVGIPGSDPAISVSGGRQSCHLYQKYLVSTVDTEEQSGEHILVQLNEGDRNGARFDDQGHWFFVVPNDEDHNYWFSGIYGNLLFVDEGCCPGPRGLTIYDLDSKKEVYSTSCIVGTIRGTVLSMWVEEKARATKSECPEGKDWQYGGGVAIERAIDLELQSMKPIKRKETRCIGRQ